MSELLRRKHIKTFTDFLERVTKTPNGCWSIGCWHKPDGYGRIRYKGRKYLAHRLAFILHSGKDPGPLLVCHKCDNPGCVNPAHLFLGINLDNIKDRMQKGRTKTPKGEEHGCAKLTGAKVLKIRELAKQGWMPKELGPRFGVTPSNVVRILKRNTWKTV